MNDLLNFILSQIVGFPDKISIKEDNPESGSTVYKLTVDPSDMGKVIGKDGKIIRAIRTIAKIWAVKQNQHIDVELVESSL